MKYVYSVEVSEDCVSVKGKIPIEEIGHVLNIFEKKGFDNIVPGDGNSCLLLKRTNEKQNEIKEEKKVTCDEYELLSMKIKIQALKEIIVNLIENDHIHPYSLGCTISRLSSLCDEGAGDFYSLLPEGSPNSNMANK